MNSQSSDETPAKLSFKDLGRTGMLALVWAVVPALATIAIVAWIGDIAPSIASLGSAAPWVFAACFALAAGLGLVPTYSPSFLAGWTFGFATGLTSALGALLFAGAIGYVVARAVAVVEVRALLARFPKAEAVRRELVGRGPWSSGGVVALLRVPPNSPFSLMNLALGASEVAFVPYLLGSLAGIAPRTAVYVGMGAAAAAGGARSLEEALDQGPGWPIVVTGAILIFVVLNLLGRMAQRALDRIANGADAHTAT